MECPSCNKQNPEDAKFEEILKCLHCGNELETDDSSETPIGEKLAKKIASQTWNCPDCNTENSGLVHFCPSCGKRNPKSRNVIYHPFWAKVLFLLGGAILGWVFMILVEIALFPGASISRVLTFIALFLGAFLGNRLLHAVMREYVRQGKFALNRYTIILGVIVLILIFIIQSVIFRFT